uniref:Uncharacterized protein n=1 Tax=Ascaris lumbricoides TaxID=6252 RepID=A0A0M3IR61_ASCLU
MQSTSESTTVALVEAPERVVAMRMKRAISKVSNKHLMIHQSFRHFTPKFL